MFVEDASRWKVLRGGEVNFRVKFAFVGSAVPNEVR